MAQDFSIVFMGTPEFAVHSLKAIIENDIRVSGVVTAVDKPAGRGRNLKSSPVKTFASSEKLLVLQPKNLKDLKFQQELKSLKADLFVVVAFRMLPESVWSMPSNGTINLHGSLLPKYRGAAPINWAIMNGEKQSGVTTFFIEKQIDTGRIIFQEKVNIEIDMTAGELHDKLAQIGAQLLVKTIKAIKDGSVNSIEQKQYNITPSKAPKIFREDCRVNWNQNYEVVYNHIRGLSPYPSAWTQFSGEKKKTIKILSATKDGDFHQKQPGIIVSDNKEFLKVAALDGWIYLKEVIPEGKGKMSIKSFLNGNEIQKNERFI